MKKAIIIVLFILTMSFSAATVLTMSLPQSEAALQQLVLFPFGGNILWVLPCTCSGNWLLVIGPPRPVVAVYQPFTITHAYYMVYTVGPETLGLTQPFGYCYLYVGYGCANVPVPNGSMFRIGTSLTVSV